MRPDRRRCDSQRFLSEAVPKVEAPRSWHILRGFGPAQLRPQGAPGNTDLPRCRQEPTAAHHATVRCRYRHLHRSRELLRRSIHAGFREFPRQYSKDLELKGLGRGECSAWPAWPAKIYGVQECLQKLAQLCPVQFSLKPPGSTGDSNAAL